MFRGETNIRLTNGFRMECYNIVGIQSLNAGKENIPLIDEYNSYAKAVEFEYPFCAEIFRSVAKEFERESKERRECAVHEY